MIFEIHDGVMNSESCLFFINLRSSDHFSTTTQNMTTSNSILKKEKVFLVGRLVAVGGFHEQLLMKAIIIGLKE